MRLGLPQWRRLLVLDLGANLCERAISLPAWRIVIPTPSVCVAPQQIDSRRYITTNNSILRSVFLRYPTNKVITMNKHIALSFFLGVVATVNARVSFLYGYFSFNLRLQFGNFPSKYVYWFAHTRNTLDPFVCIFPLLCVDPSIFYLEILRLPLPTRTVKTETCKQRRITLMKLVTCVTIALMVVASNWVNATSAGSPRAKMAKSSSATTASRRGNNSTQTTISPSITSNTTEFCVIRITSRVVQVAHLVDTALLRIVASWKN